MDVFHLLGQALPYVLVALVAFGAGLIGAITGYGTGLLLPPVLVPVIGPAAVVPVIGLSSLLSNASRLYIYFSSFDRKKALVLSAVALPTTVLGALGYTLLSGAHIMVLIGAVLIVLVPVRKILKRTGRQMSDGGVLAAGAGYGLLVGGTAGSGAVLMSILLGAGLSGPAVIATDSAISMVLGMVKSATFFVRGALPWPMIVTALLVGACAVPGAFVAKRLALKLEGEAHIRILDAVVIVGGLLLIWRGLTA